MSNPLLQPDGRFRRANVADEQGRNRFADEQGAASPENVSNHILAAPLGGDATPGYQPRYQVSWSHRGPLVAWLGVIGCGLSWMLLLAFTRFTYLGLAASLFGVALSLATAVIAYQDLKGMSLGAIDLAGRSATLLGFRFALAGIFVGGGAALAVVWLIVRGVVELGL
jgi:hypothetical protein